jgi:hypothetical protein
VKSLEEIAYDAGRHALADQQALVSGVQQRTGTLLAAHAIVASFLGTTTLRSAGMDVLGWTALAALAGGLIVAAVLLAPWPMRFAVDARELHQRLRGAADATDPQHADGRLVAAAYGYQAMHDANAAGVRAMLRLSACLSALLVVQTLGWLACFALES